MKVGDLVRWSDPNFPEDDDLGVVIDFIGGISSAEVYWFGEQDEYRYDLDHPNLELISESR